MHTRFAAFTLFLLALGAASLAPRGAVAQLGTSAWSLEIGSSLGAGDFDGTFAIRRHSGAASAFRFGVEVDTRKSDAEGVVTETGAPDEDAAELSESSDYTFSIQYMRFAPIRNNVTGTFALGPVVQLDRSSFRFSQDIGQPGFTEFENKGDITSFGLDLALGVEWFFNPRFSLGGSAGIRALTGSGEQVNIQRSGDGATYSVEEENLDVDRTDISTERARIYLAAYF